MDYVRIGYITEMKLWVNSDTLTPVRWYRAEPEAKLFPGVCSLRSRFTWNQFQPFSSGAVGEQSRDYAYDKGQNLLGYAGLHYCGSGEAGRTGGVSGRDEPVEVLDGGVTPCCGPPPFVVCGHPMPDAWLLSNGVVAHCACVSGTSWSLTYAGTAGGPNLPAGRHAWLTAGEWWPVSGPLGPPPAWVPFWGSCIYAPPVEVPARVQFAILLDPDTCTVILLVWQFWWKGGAVNSVLYGSSFLTVDQWVAAGYVFPAITSMHGESCGTGSGGGNPIVYTAEPVD